jgi:2-iminobutanoate/2-iminopropanoate deaminase
VRKPLLRLMAIALLLAFPAGVLSQSAAPKAAPKDEKKEGTLTSMRYIASDDAPKAIGPYSQAVIEGGFLFASGQIPLDPKTGELVGGSIEPSAERVFDNLEAVLKAAGLSWPDVVKTTVYLVRAEDFAAMNGVYARRMGDHKPARSTIIVAALPKSAPLEIDLIARTRH